MATDNDDAPENVRGAHIKSQSDVPQMSQAHNIEHRLARIEKRLDLIDHYLREYVLPPESLQADSDKHKNGYL